MGKIKQMDRSLANQIAAGEVVERPASVVKELVENAIDANAHHIQVEVKEAGIQQIKVIDDGVGMNKDDLHMTYLPHATSKIYSVHDLFQIQSLGFRGEALASIASVAKVRIESSLSRGQYVNQGYYIEVENSKLIQSGTCPPRGGTIVQVDSLFYNTPARLKHLASLKTEMRHIITIMQDLALAYPEIAFVLKSEEQTVVQTIGNGDLRQTIANLYQPYLARELLKIKQANDEFEIWGYISPPQQTRTSRHYIHWMVNGRVVKSPRLSNVLLSAYGKQLMIGRFPLSFIHIQLDPRLVDVNVHPTKQTIRLSKEEDLSLLLTQAIETTLKQHRTVPEAGETLFKRKGYNPKDQSLVLDYQFAPEVGRTIPHTEFNKEIICEEVENVQIPTPAPSIQESTDEEIEIAGAQIDSNKSRPELKKETAGIDFASLRYVGQIHGTYLIAESLTGFFLIDQHAAQERLRYEQLMKNHPETLNQQQLLVPKLFEFDQNLSVLVEEHAEKLQELGIFLQAFGPKSYQLEAYPVWIEADELDRLIPDIIEKLKQQPHLSINEMREASIIMQSCRGAIKANQYLTKEEAIQLIHDMQFLEDPYHCPHGRPVFVEFDQKTLEKLFKRIQDSHQGGRIYE
ncbi:DNA mismatch repair endonuclease MutL [Facklamia sp. DSM 111018]|uniref:DNA mismatch repair protein MutL n=1 Tax=Facklamia lactis TaxID=2749967 RepID=A0ABS0LMV0_9LACT|nr:DNA mismatch repair endonuclease MutL [Facklamia lactis]MBG9979825.1 DNA mismatch repair endonuclease MutL [Facklamia lactis]MBG9985495.1 DNA mismatch repair endonuclease MutL [Facklamia lactis]